MPKPTSYRIHAETNSSCRSLHLEPKDWQNQYSEKQAHLDFLARAGRLIVPIFFGMLPPILFLIMYIGHLLENSSTTEIATGPPRTRRRSSAGHDYFNHLLD